MKQFATVFLFILFASQLYAADKAAEKPKADAVSPEIAKLVDGVRDYYRKAGDFSTTFKQAYHSKITKRIKSSEGNVDFAKPAKMRWDYEKPDKKTFMTDGETLWVVRWEEKQVQVRKQLNASELESSLAFLWGGGDLVRDYDLTKLQIPNVEGVVDTGNRLVLEMLPKKAAQFDTLYLLINPKSYRIEEAVLIDTLGNINHLTFGDPKTGQTFKPERFSFKAPGNDWATEEIGF